MLPHLALVAVALALLAAACGASVAQQVLVYEKPATELSNWGWIWRARPDGSHPEKLVLGYSPLVSPDGRWVAYTHRGTLSVGGTTSGTGSLWLVSSQEGRSTQVSIASGCFEVLAWSPDSRRVLVAGSPGLLIVDRARAAARVLVREPRGVGTSAAGFSPDGRSIVYDRSHGNGVDIDVVPADGGASRPLTRDGTSFDPVWGPSSIAYFHGLGNTSGDVWLMAGDGSGKRQLTHTNAAFWPAAWSHDGRHRLAANPAEHNGRLWAVDVPSGRARPLTPWLGDLFPQGLSADGRTVYAAIGCGGRIDPSGILETIPFSGGPPRVIVRGPCRGSWSR